LINVMRTLQSVPMSFATMLATKPRSITVTQHIVRLIRQLLNVLCHSLQLKNAIRMCLIATGIYVIKEIIWRGFNIVIRRGAKHIKLKHNV
jgi:hypothetical protein